MKTYFFGDVLWPSIRLRIHIESSVWECEPSMVTLHPSTENRNVPRSKARMMMKPTKTCSDESVHLVSPEPIGYKRSYEKTTHTIHVWYVSNHLPIKSTKCRYKYCYCIPYMDGTWYKCPKINGFHWGDFTLISGVMGFLLLAGFWVHFVCWYGI